MTYRTPTPVPEEAVEAVAAALSADTQLRTGVRSLNVGRPTGADVDAVLAIDDTRTAREDALRRRFFPRAARVSVDQWGVYTWSPTGRVVRKVWKIEDAQLEQLGVEHWRCDECGRVNRTMGATECYDCGEPRSVE